MKRDMRKIAGTSWKGIPYPYQPGADDYVIFLEIADNSLWNAFDILFRFGFQLGRRCEKRHGKKVK